MHNPFIEKFIESRSFDSFFRSFEKKAGNLVCDEDIWPFTVSALLSKLKIPVLVLTATADRAGELLRELKLLLEDTRVLLYPGMGITGIVSMLKDSKTPGDILSGRFEILKQISDYSSGCKEPFIIIASASSIIDLIPDRERLEKRILVLKTGNNYKREEIISGLSESGYARVTKVYDKGEFSFRGDVLDIFNIASANPVRADFSGEKLEGIFTYNLDDNSLLERIDSMEIFPCTDSDTGTAALKKTSVVEFIAENTKRFLPVACDPLEINLKLESDIGIILKSISMESSGLIEAQNYHSRLICGNYLDFIKKEKHIDFLNIHSTSVDSENYTGFKFNSLKKQKKSMGNADIFIQNLKKDIGSKKNIAISSGNRERLERILRFLTDAGISFSWMDSTPNEASEPSVVRLLDRDLLTGFESEDFSLYGELDIYQETDTESAPDADSYVFKAQEFNPGDFVVHRTHGIGKFLDIVSEQILGNKKEFFLIEYANNDKLYVPVWQSERIHRYIGDKIPQISTLNSRQWENLKKKVRTSVKYLAVDLSMLYAERNIIEGHAFGPDGVWQQEMEDLFPFQETRDQKEAIDYVKALMEKPKPMDLLLCGDVGFGKTEVAVRAAFKAMENSKQVLMLVPTTILADQHFKTFSDRFKNFPVTVEVISRFKKPVEQKKIIEDFKNARTDMLIGTHRILSEDIKPRDLGLVIIDEEQRFGVNAKEKLKLFKKSVDVITLSATPIPRTLYMSLSGVRDIFLIETHPAGRFPVETFVGEKNDLLIRMAIEREMARGGQVFYVHNRIHDIDEVRYRLQVLVPRAEIALAHGRMEAKEIEKVMEDFINRKYNVLLTTSIIESGMDIANANTLIVDDSHKFGLSQLYQLRGRVGRSHEHAYSYFFYPGKRMLNVQSFQRLRTLAEYTDLGSGYKIALRDLEIRGAGELLGARQHGSINSIGFDLYCQIVKEEVERLKGIEIEEDVNIQIELPLSAYIPRNYIRSEAQRVMLYRLIGGIRNSEEAEKIRADLEKKHGRLPETVKNIVDIGEIKYLAKEALIEKVYFSGSKGIVFKKPDIENEKIIKLQLKYKNIHYNRKIREFTILCAEKDLNTGQIISVLRDICAIK